jgi:virginiamycin B lyase
VRALRRLPLSCLLGLAGTLLLAASAAAVPCGSDRCRSFPAPGASGAIAPGPDGRLWFVGHGFVGRLATGGQVDRFPAPVTPASDIEPSPDGGMWFTGPGVVGRMGTDGQVTMTKPVSGTPGPIVPTAEGPTWLSGPAGPVFRLAGDGALLRLAGPPGPAASGAGAAAMVRGHDGALWAIDSASAPQLRRIAADGTSAPVALPGVGSHPAALAVGPDGGIWFTAPQSKQVGRVSPLTQRVITFRTSWNPHAITAGPSHAIWFAMTDRGRWTVTRLVPAGYMSFFQVRGPVNGLAAGADDGIYIARGDQVERLEPFLGAYPIRSRLLPISFAGSVTLRLYCPKYDLVFCAGTITLRHRGRVLGAVPFSQRVHDAPSTRIVLNAYGRRLARRLGRRRLRILARIDQHDNGGVRRVSEHAFYLTGRRR